MKFVQTHTEEFRGTKKAEKPKAAVRDLSPCPGPASAVPAIPQSHGPGVAPTLWGHCPGAQDTLWGTEEKLPGTGHDLLCGFSREKRYQNR